MKKILDDNDYLDVWGKFNGKKPSKLKEKSNFYGKWVNEKCACKTGT